MPKKRRVIINGFLINSICPSEERLTMRINLSFMPGYRHVDWVGVLQDLLREIDEAYREKRGYKRTSRGRSVRVRYVKDAKGKQRKVALFQPYPSLIVNGLKELRRQMYEDLNTHCIILQEERIGRTKRKLYFLPAATAPKLMVEIEQHNEELEKIKKSVKAFEKSRDFKLILNHVKETGEEMEWLHPNLSRIRVSPIPLSLSKAFFEKYLEEERKKALVSVDETRRKGLEALEREVEAKRQEMIEAIQRGLEQRFTVLLETTEEAVKNLGKGRQKKGLKKKFSNLQNLVEDVGIEFSEKPFSALGSVLESVDNRDADALAKSVNELAESLGIQPTGNPVRDIGLATKAAKGESLLLFTID